MLSTIAIAPSRWPDGRGMPPWRLAGTCFLVFSLTACSGTESVVWEGKAVADLLGEQAADATGAKGALWGLRALPDGSFVAVGDDGEVRLTQKLDGTWSNGTSGTQETLWALEQTPDGQLLAVGDNGVVIESNNGGSLWTSSPSGTSKALLSVAYQNAVRIAVGSEGAVVRHVAGLDPWSPVDSGTQKTLRKVVATKKGNWIAVGDEGAVLYSTNDGKSWLPGSSSEIHGLRDVVAASDGSLVAVGDAGRVLRSNDEGRTWAREAIQDTRLLHRVIETSTKALVAVGDKGAVLRLGPGALKWELVPAGPPATWRDIAEDGKGTLWVVGTRGSVISSRSGGLSWSPASVATNEALLRVVGLARGGLVAAGNSGVAIRTLASGRMAPTITRISSSPGVAGSLTGPRLTIEILDPENRCPGGSCLTLEALNEQDESLRRSGRVDVRPRPVERSTWNATVPGKVVIPIDMPALSARKAEPVYLGATINVPGYSRVYRDADGHLVKVATDIVPWWEQTIYATGGTIVAVALALTALLFFRPKWLLPLARNPNRANEAMTEISPITKAAAAVVRSVLFPIVLRHPRLLDAWVAENRVNFSSELDRATAKSQGFTDHFVPLPIEFPGRVTDTPTLDRLTSVLSQFRQEKTQMQILGQGGAGKTSLALHIAKLIMLEGAAGNPCCVIFIDEEFDDLLATITRKVSAIASINPGKDLLDTLLRSGRICTIIDRLSEKTPGTQEAVQKLYATISPRLLLITARSEIQIEGVATAKLEPRPLDGTFVVSFLTEEMRASGDAATHHDLELQGRLISGLARLITVDTTRMPVTPLLVKVFVAQAMDSIQRLGIEALEALPSNVPEAYFSYIAQLDPLRTNAAQYSAHSIRGAALTLADVELGEDFRPKRIPISNVKRAFEQDSLLNKEADALLQRLRGTGLLSERASGGDLLVGFALDPLAECLAAHAHARRCGGDTNKWEALLAKIRKQDRDPAGMISALRMNHAAYKDELGFPMVSFEPAMQSAEQPEDG